MYLKINKKELCWILLFVVVAPSTFLVDENVLFRLNFDVPSTRFAIREMKSSLFDSNIMYSSNIKCENYRLVLDIFVDIAQQFHCRQNVCFRPNFQVL